MSRFCPFLEKKIHKMDRNLLISLSLLFFILTLHGCKNREAEEIRVPLSNEQLININRELAIKERERIESYIHRKNLSMQMSDLGIWYSILEEGKGARLTNGSSVSLEYTCSLLDGTLCYSSDKDGILNVVIGRSEIATGLDEALRMMKLGTDAMIILPSNLAYGLVGDGDRIPSRAALFYKIKVLPR